jgi:hypothetical protein
MLFSKICVCVHRHNVCYLIFELFLSSVHQEYL